MNLKFLTIDTETGGLDPNYHSLFEVSFSFNTLELDATGNYTARELSHLYVKIKEELLHYTTRAIEINNIDVTNWTGYSPEEASEIIDNYLGGVYQSVGENIPILGHNVAFDLSFLERLPCYNDRHCTKYFSHRIIDTSSLGRMVSLVIENPIDLSKSNNLFDFFNLTSNNRHSSQVDVANTTQAFVSILNLLRTNLNSNSNS